MCARAHFASSGRAAPFICAEPQSLDAGIAVGRFAPGSLLVSRVDYWCEHGFVRDPEPSTGADGAMLRGRPRPRLILKLLCFTLERDVLLSGT